LTLPNFLIVGAAKSGTTSLFVYLGQHPEIYTPFCKEPCYFTKQKEPSMVHSDADYEMLFEGERGEKAIGEASTTYLYDREAPERIHRLLGDNLRIIIILRNPVRRAYSLWGHNYYQVGCEELPFEDALRQEGARMASLEFRAKWRFHYGNFHYFRSGLYYEQVKRYLDTFGRERVQVYIFEEFAEEPGETCRKVFAFLGVDPSFRPVFARHNASPGFKNKVIHRFLATPPLLLLRLYQALPMKVRMLGYRAGKAIYWLNQGYKPRPPMDQKLGAELMDRYREDIKKLEGLLERDLAIWYDRDESHVGPDPSDMIL